MDQTLMAAVIMMAAAEVLIPIMVVVVGVVIDGVIAAIKSVDGIARNRFANADVNATESVGTAAGTMKRHTDT